MDTSLKTTAEQFGVHLEEVARVALVLDASALLLLDRWRQSKVLRPNVGDHIATLFRGKATFVPGAAVRFRSQVHPLVIGQRRIGPEGLGTSTKLTRVLLWHMCGQLVILHHDSSIRGVVAVGMGTFKYSGLVIQPDMSPQTVLSFHHTRALATVPSTQAAVSLSIMGFELITKIRRNILVTCEIM